MRNSLVKNAFFALAAMCFALLAPSWALAHRISVFAYSEGSRVVTESYFSGGNPAKGARIEVFDPAGKKLLEGRTDRQGGFSFPIPKEPSDLKIVLVASQGHRGEFTLSAAELRPDDDAARPQPETVVPKAQETASYREVSPDALEPLIDRVLTKRLAPLYRMVAELKKERVSPTEVAGGIGYIVGILGIYAYFKSRGSSRDGPG